jgi:hypothetical protein
MFLGRAVSPYDRKGRFDSGHVLRESFQNSLGSKGVGDFLKLVRFWSWYHYFAEFILKSS